MWSPSISTGSQLAKFVSVLKLSEINKTKQSKEFT